MKLLKSVANSQEAHGIAERLKSRGILTFISSKGMNSLYPNQQVVKTGIWVVADNQFDDAVEVLINPDHEVQHPLSAEEMAVLSKQLNTSYAAAVKMGIRVGVYVVFGIAALALIAYVLHEFI